MYLDTLVNARNSRSPVIIMYFYHLTMVIAWSGCSIFVWGYWVSITNSKG